jgi:3-phenylpropionate/trans-cinnamate dioxygenase ferredoxin reductase subunit
MSDVVIIGAGQAGLQLASSLRDNGFAGSITMVGDEVHPPYQRPPLSKAFLAGAAPEAMLFMQEPRFFADRAIDFRGSEAVETIDRDLKQVNLRSGAFLSYSHLVIATGTRNRALSCVEGETSGVVSLRTIEDARALMQGLERAAKLVVIGAGFLGLEAASIASDAKIDVRVIEASSRALGRVVSAPVSEAVQAAHEARGVAFSFNEAVVALHATDGHVSSVELGSGERISADLVLVSIGVVPNSELAAACGLTVHNGVVVDARLLTEDPNISSIGDCAAFPFAADDGRMVRLESVQNAVDQARCVADRLTGKIEAYDQVPTFWSDQAGLRLQMAGLARGDEDVVVRRDPATGNFSAYCYREDVLVAVESVNRLPDHMQARKLLRMKISPSREQAGDPAFDLKQLVNKETAA